MLSKFKRLGVYLWPLFWVYYFAYRDTPEFRQDYTEAWRQKYLAEDVHGSDSLRYITIFIDYGLCMEVPCSSSMTDAQLLETPTFILHLSEVGRRVVGGIANQDCEPYRRG